MMAVSPRWESTPCDDDAAERLAIAINVPPVVARLLCQRGFSDPERAARFLNPSLDQLHDPMALADMKIAVDRGRATRPDIKLGICGEHGGDPSSINFCHQIGLAYVSCSPFRVPVARLAAAQAALKNGGVKKK